MSNEAHRQHRPAEVFEATFAQRWMVALFAAVLVLPGLVMLVPERTQDANRLRFEATSPPPPTPRSPGALARYPRDYVGYFNGHFGLRRPLMGAYARLKLAGLAVSDSQRVIVGEDGWLYFAGDRIVDDLRGLLPFEERDLAAWARLLARRRDWLAARGIPYVFLIAPNTHTIYPEHLPSWIVRGSTTTRREQLLAYLKEHSDVPVLDLVPPLRAAKEREQVYYRTDTHWNLVGGFVAYQTLSAWLAGVLPGWHRYEESDFVRSETPHWRGGLGYMLGAPELAEETRPEITARQGATILTDGAPLPADETTDAWTVRPIVVRQSADGEIGTAVVFRDSQFSAPAQFLSRHFRRTVLVWQPTFDPAVVLREHPQVVIHEVVERTLTGPVPEDPPFEP
ncbi:MAG: hypothetical protein JWP97_4728 [Labilithrix sp.]|nr:hypothetical protein [Labilithrix sp.]